MKTNIKRFYYKKHFSKSYLFTGIAYLLIGTSSLIFEYKYLYFFTILGAAFIVEYYLSKTKGYISIDDKYIRKHRGWPKKIKLEDIGGIRYYVGDLTILTDKKSLSIDKEFLQEEDFDALELQIKKVISTNKSDKSKL
jgi:hypothetical protein